MKDNSQTERPLVVTGDGSHTLYNAEIGSHYHSIHGAIQESGHVFIDAGLRAINKDNIEILEIGFGTGLNCFMTLIEANKLGLNVSYTAVEAFPINMEGAKALNYPQKLNAEKHRETFLRMHQCPFLEMVEITEGFHLMKLKGKLQDLEFANQYHLVYFDAFGPGVQPELWAKEIFSKVYDAMADGGILVTYCAKGEVKRTLKDLGFKVESLLGPPGKREMVRGTKSIGLMGI